MLVPTLAGLSLVASIAALFPPIAGVVPPVIEPAAFALAGFALGAVGAAEARMERGTVGPLWMRVPRPVNLALALALSFCTTAIAQEFGVSLGPVDPTFPADAPFETNALWFFMFTIGFAGIGSFSAASVFLPVLNPLGRMLRELPLAAAVGILGAAGAVAGLGFRAVLASPTVADLVAKLPLG
jgi:hypothetical protein